MNAKEILSKKQKGDIQIVADILNVEYENAKKILSRPNAKMHKRAVTALNKLITDREQSIKESKKIDKILEAQI